MLAAHGGLLTVDHLGTVPYRPTWELQDELADQRRGRRIGDRLLLLEHFPVYTIGRGGDAANMLATPERLREIGAELIRIDRGGDITFHGPGQLVAYPIVELRDPLDLRRYVRILESAVIDTAAVFGVDAARLEGLPGIWVEGKRKLAAIGVRVKRGVTTHGLALNVNTDLRWFDEMIPCGIPDKEVTSAGARDWRQPSRWRGSRMSWPGSLPPTSACGSPKAHRASSVRPADGSSDRGRDGRRALRHARRSGTRRAHRGRPLRPVANERLPRLGRALPDALVLDPGMGAAAPLMERVTVNGLRLHLIANSHGHIDHIFDNGPLMRAAGAPLAIHPDDAYRLEGRNNYGFEIERSVATQDLSEGEQLRIGDLAFDILHTPGHSEGSVCLYEERLGLMLSGDVLFAGSYGRTDLPGGNDEQMVASLTRLARDIPAPVRVLPGHGPETTVERELPWLRRVVESGRLVVPG